MPLSFYSPSEVDRGERMELFRSTCREQYSLSETDWDERMKLFRSTCHYIQPIWRWLRGVSNLVFYTKSTITVISGWWWLRGKKWRCWSQHVTVFYNLHMKLIEGKERSSSALHVTIYSLFEATIYSLCEADWRERMKLFRFTCHEQYSLSEADWGERM